MKLTRVFTALWAGLFVLEVVTMNAQETTTPPDNPAAPGKMHEHLKSFVGTWDQSLKITPAPQVPPLVAQATTQAEMIYEGRFLKMEGQVEVAGQTGESVIYIGHNNLTGQYSFYNIASVATDTTFAQGTFDEATRTFTFRGENQDPATGQPRKFRIEIKLVDENTIEQTNYFALPEGGEAKVVEVTSTRVK